MCAFLFNSYPLLWIVLNEDWWIDNACSKTMSFWVSELQSDVDLSLGYPGIHRYPTQKKTPLEQCSKRWIYSIRLVSWFIGILLECPLIIAHLFDESLDSQLESCSAQIHQQLSTCGWNQGTFQLYQNVEYMSDLLQQFWEGSHTKPWSIVRVKSVDRVCYQLHRRQIQFYQNILVNAIYLLCVHLR